jgi:hypothetical protein
VVGYCEHGDEPSGSGSTELVTADTNSYHMCSVKFIISKIVSNKNV